MKKIILYLLVLILLLTTAACRQKTMPEKSNDSNNKTATSINTKKEKSNNSTNNNSSSNNKTEEKKSIESKKQTSNITIDETTLKNLVEKTVNDINGWALLYGLPYTSFDDRVSTGSEDSYILPIYYDGVYCKEDLRPILSETYSSKVVNKVLSSNNLVEQDGMLYTALYGIGGTSPAIIKVIATDNGDNTYNVSLKLADESFGSVDSKLINENGQFVFDELVTSYWAGIADDCEYIIN